MTEMLTLRDADVAKSPETITDIIAENPVYLISADLPGCGSTTLTNGIAERIKTTYGVEPHVTQIGSALRKALGVTNEVQLQTRLAEINDPHHFDPQFYGELPTDRPCIIDGKLATTVGPQYIADGRPIISIDLTSQPLVSAKRVLQREGKPFTQIYQDPESGVALLGKLAMIQNRAAHDMDMRDTVRTEEEDDDSNIMRFSVDTSRTSTFELIDFFTGTANSAETVPEWEALALRQTLATLAHLHIMLDGKVHPIDVSHFEHQFESIRFNLDRLEIMTHPAGIASARDNLKKALTDCWFGLMMKQAPRFFANTEGGIDLDTESQSWTPEFYKIAEGWPILSTLLKDKEVLDPFAGAGTLVNLLVARNIPKSAVLSDIAYNGGMPVDKEGHTYLPILNNQVSQLLFDGLPSWYRPDFTPIRGYITGNAQVLPFKDKSFDYIVADPPYGKNCATGGVDLLLGSLDEFKRVTRDGAILMVPMKWIEDITAAGHKVTQLTRDVSRGHSKLPVCYIMVESKEPEKA